MPNLHIEQQLQPKQPGVAVCAWNPSTEEAEVDWSSLACLWRYLGKLDSVKDSASKFKVERKTVDINLWPSHVCTLKFLLYTHVNTHNEHTHVYTHTIHIHTPPKISKSNK